MISSKSISSYQSGEILDRLDAITIEEPLEIRLGFGPKKNREQKSISVTMRTPGQDDELAIGFLTTEAIIDSFSDVVSVKYCPDIKAEEKNNVIRVELSPHVIIDWKKLDRHFYTTSSCGVCGKSSIEAVTNNCNTRIPATCVIPAKILLGLPNKLREAQTAFKYSGGIHGVALFDVNGRLLQVREDVGRHNALDKLIGKSVLSEQLPLTNSILLLSGRISFELVQKAVVAGIPIIAAIGAPSSLAIELAQQMNITLVGFLKNDTFNIYCGQKRIKHLQNDK